jgi:AcrR family transcriptional regulator
VTSEHPRVERADAARNRRAILDAAAKLLAERRADTVSIEQIAVAAGVGKGTVFHRFGNRAGLLRELVMERAETLRLAVVSGEPPLGPGAPARERLLAFFAAWADLAIDNFELYAAYSTGAPDPRAEDFHAFWYRHIAQLLRELRPGIVDAELQAQLLFMGTFASPVSLQLFRAGQGDRLKDAVLDIVEAVAASR